MVGEPLVHQSIELPPVLAEVTQWELLECLCPGCGTTTRATLPEGAPTTLVGPRLQAVFSLLTGRGRLSRREAREMAVEAFGEKARVSLGTVAAMERRTSAALAAACEEALDTVRKAPVVNGGRSTIDTRFEARGARA